MTTEEKFLLNAFGSGYKNYVPWPHERKVVCRLIKKDIVYAKGAGHYCLTENGATIYEKIIKKRIIKEAFSKPKMKTIF